MYADDIFVRFENKKNLKTKTKERGKHSPIGSCFTLHFFNSCSSRFLGALQQNTSTEHSRGFFICYSQTLADRLVFHPTLLLCSARSKPFNFIRVSNVEGLKSKFKYNRILQKTFCYGKS